MNDDIRDILLVFLVDSLSAIARTQTVQLPAGLLDFIRTEAIESNADLPFPADVRELLYVYILNQNRS